MESINERRKFTRNMKMINSCPPKVIFQELSWMANETEVINFLFNQVSTKIFEPGDVVCIEGEKSCGVIVIITGMKFAKLFCHLILIFHLKVFSNPVTNPREER